MKKRVFLLSLLIILLVLITVLTSCSKINVEAENAVATVNANGKELYFDVAPDPELLETYNGSTLYLFRLPLGTSGSDLASLTPIAVAKAKNTVRFRVSIKNDISTYLYSSYVAAFLNEDTGVYIQAHKMPVFVNNPQELAKNREDYPKTNSKKGINSLYGAETSELFVDHAVIDIPVENYLLKTGENRAVFYVFDGQSYYINRDELEKLDERVKLLSGNGTVVYFRFTLKKNISELPDGLKFLSASESNKSADFYQLNMNDPECASAVAGIADFFAKRYASSGGSYGKVSAYIAGYDLNSNGDVAGASLFVRMLYNALVSQYANGKVYVSVDEKWRNNSNNDGQTFLTKFAEASKTQGDYPWAVSVKVRSTAVYSDRVWLDDTNNTSTLSPVRLNNLTGMNFLSSPIMLYNGKMRNTMIGDFAVEITDSPDTELNQALSYAYMYYKTYSVDNIDALIYSYETDTKNTVAGLHSVSNKGEIGNERRIANTIRYIDTDIEMSAVAYGYEKIPELISLFDTYSERVRVTRYCSGGTVAGVDISEYEISDITGIKNGSLTGFSAVGEGSYLGLIRNGNGSSLTATLQRSHTADTPYILYNGLDNRSLNKDQLFITASINGEADASTIYDVTVTLIKHDEKNGDLIYRSTAGNIKPGESVPIYFDIKPFRSNAGRGEFEMHISAVGKDGSGCSVRIDSISTGKAVTNVWLVVILIVLVVLAVAGITVFGIIWFRRSGLTLRDVFGRKNN